MPGFRNLHMAVFGRDMRLFLVFPFISTAVVGLTIVLLIIYVPFSDSKNIFLLENGYQADFDFREPDEFYFLFFLVSIIILPLAGVSFWLQFFDLKQHLKIQNWKNHLKEFLRRFFWLLIFLMFFWIYIVSIICFYKESQFLGFPQAKSFVVNGQGIRVPYSILHGDPVIPFYRIMKGDMILNNQGVVFIPWEHIKEWTVEPKTRGRNSTPPVYRITYNAEIFSNTFTNKFLVNRERIRKHDRKIIEIAKKNLRPIYSENALNIPLRPRIAWHPLVLNDKPLAEYESY